MIGILDFDLSAFVIWCFLSVFILRMPEIAKRCLCFSFCSHFIWNWISFCSWMPNTNLLVVDFPDAANFWIYALQHHNSIWIQELLNWITLNCFFCFDVIESIFAWNVKSTLLQNKYLPNDKSESWSIFTIRYALFSLSLLCWFIETPMFSQSWSTHEKLTFDGLITKFEAI